MVPLSLAPRLNTHPPQPMIAPVSVRIKRDGSTTETAFISRTQGTVVDLAGVCFAALRTSLPLYRRPATGVYTLFKSRTFPARAWNRLAPRRVQERYSETFAGNLVDRGL